MSRRARTAAKRGGPSQAAPSFERAKPPLSLVELTSGRTARVLRIQGGAQFSGRMEALGIVPGAVITKKSAISARGPIVVERGSVQLALGHDMGQSILVEPAEREQ